MRSLATTLSKVPNKGLKPYSTTFSNVIKSSNDHLDISEFMGTPNGLNSFRLPIDSKKLNHRHLIQHTEKSDESSIN